MSDELDRLVRSAVPEVLTAALDRAREQAVTRLADLMTEAIVAQALAGGRVRGDVDRRPEPDQPHATGEALYAYGITLAGLPLPDDVPALTGEGGLERVTAGELALLVSRVTPDALRVDEEDLSETGRLATLARAHDAVVRAAAGAGPVLPLRFGTVVPDETAARRLLAEQGEAARSQLRLIGTNHEWGVKLVRRLDGPAPDPSTADEPAAAGAQSSGRTGVTGTQYLARRQQALRDRDAVEQRAAQAADLVEETLRPHVTESVRRGGSPGSSLLLDLAFLVPPDREAGFLAAAAELRERLEPDGLEVEASGPWPPYSFAALGAGDA